MKPEEDLPPFEENDPMMRLGSCCGCGRIDSSVRNVVMINRRSPEPGWGCWGCVICGLDTAGAIAVMCDDCMPSLATGSPKFACVGVPEHNRRIPFEELTVEFNHDMSKHQEEENYYAENRQTDHQGNGHARKRASYRRNPTP